MKLFSENFLSNFLRAYYVVNNSRFIRKYTLEVNYDDYEILKLKRKTFWKKFLNFILILDGHNEFCYYQARVSNHVTFEKYQIFKESQNYSVYKGWH